MAAAFPEPLTPPDCDLRGMPFMPVDIVRLFDSDLYALSTGDEFKAAFTLWGKAFLQVPAGSLPDNPRILAHLSGAGPAWQVVAEMALRGWLKCSDGRFYHPVVAEKAREAWAARLGQRARTEAARAARAARRVEHDNGRPSPIHHTPSATTGTRADAAEHVTSSVTEEKTSVTDNATETVTGSKGQRQGQGQGIEEESFALLSDQGSDAPAPVEEEPSSTPKRRRTRRAPGWEPEGFAEFYEAYPRHEARQAAAWAYMGAVQTAGGQQAMMEGLRRFRFDPDRKFIPLPASWLNGQRWKDVQSGPTTKAVAAPGSVDARYFDADPREVVKLPKPPRGTPEARAWDAATMDQRTPNPTVPRKAPIA